MPINFLLQGKCLVLKNHYPLKNIAFKLSKAIVFFLSLIFIPTGAIAAKVSEYQLQNGLKILVKEDHRTPVVVSQVWYKVGGSYEPAGITGISHVLEHMMFRGSSNYSPNTLDHIVGDNGGAFNAGTGDDFTFYWEILPSEKLSEVLALEADRMQNLLLQPKSFSKEIQVVQEERLKRVDNSPFGLLWARLFLTAFPENPYGRNPIGSLHDLKHMTIKDVHRWYKQWYAPNNAVLIVAGDVEPNQVYYLAKKYFGSIKPRAIPKLSAQTINKAPKKYRIPVKAQGPIPPTLIIAFPAPIITSHTRSDDPYVLMLIAQILSGGGNAWLERHLVRGKQLATSAFASYNPFSLLSSLFLVQAMPTPTHTLADLENALQHEIEKLKTTLVDPEDLALAKARFFAEQVYQRDSLLYQATEIGSLEALGLSWNMIESLPARIQTITAQQIQAVAQRYFHFANCAIVASLHPILSHTEPPHAKSDK